MPENGEPEPPVGVQGTPTPWPGGGYMYRPGDVLAAPEMIDLVQEHVERFNGTQADVESLSHTDLVRMRVDVDVHDLISEIRNVDHDVVPPQVSPNHVLHQFSHMRFFSRLFLPCRRCNRLSLSSLMRPRVDHRDCDPGTTLTTASTAATSSWPSCCKEGCKGGSVHGEVAVHRLVEGCRRRNETALFCAYKQ